MAIEQKRGVSASFSMYICFCLNWNVIFTSEILLQFLKGCAGFRNALWHFIIQTYLAAGKEVLCAGICITSHQSCLALHASARQSWNRASTLFWSCSDSKNADNDTLWTFCCMLPRCKVLVGEQDIYWPLILWLNLVQGSATGKHGRIHNSGNDVSFFCLSGLNSVYPRF